MFRKERVPLDLQWEAQPFDGSDGARINAVLPRFVYGQHDHRLLLGHLVLDYQ